MGTWDSSTPRLSTVVDKTGETSAPSQKKADNPVINKKFFCIYPGAFCQKNKKAYRHSPIITNSDPLGHDNRYSIATKPGRKVVQAE